MPSLRNNPPEKNQTIKILRGVIANGEPQKPGAIIKVSLQDASELIQVKAAIRAEDAPAPAKAKKKAAKAKPPVDAER